MISTMTLMLGDAEDRRAAEFVLQKFASIGCRFIQGMPFTDNNGRSGMFAIFETKEEKK